MGIYNHRVHHLREGTNERVCVCVCGKRYENGGKKWVSITIILPRAVIIKIK